MSIVNGRTILVVEDWPGYSRLLEMALRDAGFDNPIQIRDSAKAALECLARHAEEGAGFTDGLLLFLDVTLPDMATDEFLVRFRRIDHEGLIPIVAMTASDQPEERRFWLARGCDAFLVKPPDARSVREAMGRLALRRGSTAA